MANNGYTDQDTERPDYPDHDQRGRGKSGADLESKLRSGQDEEVFEGAGICR